MTRFRKRSKGFRVVNTKIGLALSKVFARRGPARKALRKIALGMKCTGCGAAAGSPCLHEGVSTDLLHAERGWLGIEKVEEYER